MQHATRPVSMKEHAAVGEHTINAHTLAAQPTRVVEGVHKSHVASTQMGLEKATVDSRSPPKQTGPAEQKAHPCGGTRP